MPLYKYQCKKCDHQFEKLILEKEKVKCPHCGSGSVKRLLSTFSTPQKSKSSSNSHKGFSCPNCKI